MEQQLALICLLLHNLQPNEADTQPGFSSRWADRLWGNKRSQTKQKYSPPNPHAITPWCTRWKNKEMCPSPGCTPAWVWALDALLAHKHLPHKLPSCIFWAPTCWVHSPSVTFPFTNRNNWDVLAFLRVELFWRRQPQPMHRNNHEMSLLKALVVLFWTVPHDLEPG